METTEIKPSTQNGIESNQQPPVQAVQIPDKLTQQQALQVLVDAAKVGQSKGIFTLDDAELVNKAIKAFMSNGPVPSNG